MHLRHSTTKNGQAKKLPLVLVLACTAGVLYCVDGNQKVPTHLTSLVEAERDFARTCGEKGIRASFLEFFADDGIAFQPHPVRYKEAVKNSPAQQNSPAVTLWWEPIFSDVSAAGDMGYNTGPFVLIDNSQENPARRHGLFFSVWKRQDDGSWKVVLDYGIGTKEPYAGSRELRMAAETGWKATGAKLNVETERTGLMNAEREFLESAQNEGIVHSFTTHLSQDARMHREGLQPILGREAIGAYLSKYPVIPTWKPMFADVASSGDLGYSYGSYELKKAEETGERGYYTRVWKRGADDKWYVVLDISSPLPPERR